MGLNNSAGDFCWCWIGQDVDLGAIKLRVNQIVLEVDGSLEVLEVRVGERGNKVKRGDKVSN